MKRLLSLVLISLTFTSCNTSMETKVEIGGPSSEDKATFEKQIESFVVYLDDEKLSDPSPSQYPYNSRNAIICCSFCKFNIHLHPFLACAEVSYRVEISQAPFPNNVGEKSEVSIS